MTQVLFLWWHHSRVQHTSTYAEAHDTHAHTQRISTYADTMQQSLRTAQQNLGTVAPELMLNSTHTTA